MDQINKYDFNYPKKLIALNPLKNRQKAKMLVSTEEGLIHEEVGNLTNYLSKKDLLVFNNTKVLPCRLKAKKILNYSLSDYSEIEITLNKLESDEVWSSFCLPGRKIRVGDELQFEYDLCAKVIKKENGLYFLSFNKIYKDLIKLLDKI